MKFRKKPVIIDAIQLTVDNIREVYTWVHEQSVNTSTNYSSYQWELYESLVVTEGMRIHTLEDGKYGEVKHIASIGDWIIKGVAGEFYPCKPDIFVATYDRVDEQ